MRRFSSLMLKVRNHSGPARALGFSATGYVEWVLESLRPKSAICTSSLILTLQQERYLLVTLTALNLPAGFAFFAWTIIPDRKRSIRRIPRAVTAHWHIPSALDRWALGQSGRRHGSLCGYQ